MNLQQRIFLWLGVLVFAFSTLRPPWIEIYVRPFGDSGLTRYEKTIGSQFV